ncbi:hypothetical protein ACTFQF_07490 [Aliivibrio fischeri]|uniref:hypothetical protein n=1 Tax=Aliivibrio fischeri TaxID=668 RepID=UPI0007C4571A|nr:hypothetical protein [Aliivibrio fischeri]MBP3141046.1 hypothetical protein [Aliivibrio fischeri]MCE7574148.1 hypothetical protein [Aliivibrio fischeri]
MSIRLDIKDWQENASLSKRLKNNQDRLNEIQGCIEDALSSYYEKVLVPLNIAKKMAITEEEALMRSRGLLNDLLLYLNDYFFNITVRKGNHRSSQYNELKKKSLGNNNKYFQRVTETYRSKLSYLMFAKTQEDEEKRLTHFKAEKGIIDEKEQDSLFEETMRLSLDEQFNNSYEGREINKHLNQIELILGTLIDTNAIPHASLTLEAELLDNWLIRYNEFSGEELVFIPDSWFRSLSFLGFEERYLSHYNQKSIGRVSKRIIRNSKYRNI